MRELAAYRIILGKLKCSIYDKFGTKYSLILQEPTIENLYESQIIYENMIKEAEESGVYDENTYLKFLYKNKLWSKDEDTELKNLPKEIEKTKVSLYEAFAKTNTRNIIRKNLEKQRERHQELFDKRHKHDYMSAEGIAMMAKVYYLTAVTSIIDNSLYTIKYDDPNAILDSIINYKARFRLDEKALRDIARNEPWKSYWSCGNVFGKPAIELSEDQRNLILISQMYDSVYQSPEAPPQYVIEDDDMLDGWMIKQRKTRESEQARKELDDRLPEKVANSAMIFLPAETYEDIEKIRDMNTPEAQLVKVQRMNELNKKEEMKEEEFLDQKIKILNQLSQKG